MTYYLQNREFGEFCTGQMKEGKHRIRENYKEEGLPLGKKKF